MLHHVTRVNQDVAPKNRQVVFNTLRRWKQIDISITEAQNEARDNVKYLTTLEKFIEPLYTGNPTTIADTLPALMNSVKMIHTIARSKGSRMKVCICFCFCSSPGKFWSRERKFKCSSVDLGSAI